MGRARLDATEQAIVRWSQDHAEDAIALLEAGQWADVSVAFENGIATDDGVEWASDKGGQCSCS